MKELSNQKKNIISLIQNVFLGEKPDLIDLNAKKVCDLAKKHSIEYIIYLGLSNYNIPMDEGFVNHAKVVAAKSVNQTLELELIKKVFSSNNINFMPLKGSILQKMYPKIEYRNMADIDILVREEDLKNAGEILKELGYNEAELGGYHDVYEKPPYMHIELHRGLIHDLFEIAAYYRNIWDSDHIYHKEGSREYFFTDEDFYIYHIVHMAKHFGSVGIGFKSLIDTYIYLEKKKEKLNFDYINQELKKNWLKKFSDIIIDCVDYVFYHIEKDNIDDVITVIDYIFDSGAYGNDRNMVSVGIARDGNHRKFIMYKLFPPFRIMKRFYPILEKVPVLLPWFYFTRLLRGLFHFKTHKKVYDASKNVTEDDINKTKKIKEITGVELYDY